MRIDAHQHFWQIKRDDYGWLRPDTGVIYRDFLPPDLTPHLAEHAINQTILVQAAPTMAETRFLLELAAQTPFVAGVVGWLDFEAPEALQTLRELADNPLLVGIRPMIQDIADDDWLARPSHAPIFEAMIAHELVFDALILPRHLSRLTSVLKRHPALPTVVDHMAKPAITGGALDPWREEIGAIARFPNAHCKLSGLVTQAAANWTPSDLSPYVMHILDAFGPARILWGSDWPVVTLAASYSRWYETAEQLTCHLTKAQKAAIFGENAKTLYLSKRGKNHAQRD